MHSLRLGWYAIRLLAKLPTTVETSWNVLSCTHTITFIHRIFTQNMYVQCTSGVDITKPTALLQYTKNHSINTTLMCGMLIVCHTIDINHWSCTYNDNDNIIVHIQQCLVASRWFAVTKEHYTKPALSHKVSSLADRYTFYYSEPIEDIYM